jgi:hypothetical protein
MEKNMSSDSKGFYQAATFLGQNKEISKGILKKTACMSIEERVLIADLEWIISIYPKLDCLEDMDVPELIKSVIEPVIANEGFAKWQRDVVTDMAIKKGDPTRKDFFAKRGKNATEGDSEIDATT